MGDRQSLMSNENPRMYGLGPYGVAVVHGGPGAPGYMAPVARELAKKWGVLEPLQTATSLEGQIQELRDALERHAELPVTLIGSSWGAMLSFIVAARYPDMAKKLILVGSAVFEEKYAAGIDATRLSRLGDDERKEVQSLIEGLDDPTSKDKDKLFARLGDLFTKADAYSPLTLDLELLESQYHLYRSVWKDAAKLRRSGELLELGKHIRCPVVAIHGDHDPQPAEGVQMPLAVTLKSFRFILLRNCGHIPWIESKARVRFFEVLKEELE